MNNSFGKNFRITLYGGSHERCVGLRIEGVPAGLTIARTEFDEALSRRKSGSKGTTARHEADEPVFVSGFRNVRSTADLTTMADMNSISRQGEDVVGTDGHVKSATVETEVTDMSAGAEADCNGKWTAVETDGSEIVMEFHNRDIRPQDYGKFHIIPRPGHADFVVRNTPELCDATGGGMFSGRMTVALVAAGVVALKCLKKRFPEVEIHSDLLSVGGSADRKEWETLLDAAIADGDSLGAIVQTVATGLPIGIGDPFFDSVESVISHIVFSIPGVRGIEFGDGFKAAAMRGSEHNDPFGQDGVLLKNGAGGVNGGLTNGAPVVFRTAFKPTSSIRKPQRTWDFETGKMTELKIDGRHDACFALRTPVILEAVTAIVFADYIVESHGLITPKSR